MPASSFDLYYMQDARNNFDAMRPVPVCADANQPVVGHCQQKIHISTNCYYGYHSSNNLKSSVEVNDCEMSEAPPSAEAQLSHCTAKKRAADEDDYPLTKRLREAAEVQKERKIVPETHENLELYKSPEDLLETLFWNTHGGNIYHLIH